MIKYILVFLLSGPLFSAPCDNPSRHAHNMSGHWSRTSLAKKGVVLSIHGLNVWPHKMSDLAHYLNQQGYDVFNMALYGHRGDLREMKSATYQIFYEHAKLHLCEIIREAGEGPIIFLGHSTGAMLQGNLLYQFPQLARHQLRVIWLAPAFKLRPYARLIGTLKGSLILPSFVPKPYRANYGTSLNAYSALAQGIKNFERYFSDNPEVLPPTLIIMDPRDEFIDWKQGQNFFSRAPQVKFASINNRSSRLPRKWHHLIIDRESLGKPSWKRMKHLLQEFLATSPSR